MAQKPNLWVQGSLMAFWSGKTLGAPGSMNFYMVRIKVRWCDNNLRGLPVLGWYPQTGRQTFNMNKSEHKLIKMQIWQCLAKINTEIIFGQWPVSISRNDQFGFPVNISAIKLVPISGFNPIIINIQFENNKVDSVAAYGHLTQERE